MTTHFFNTEDTLWLITNNYQQDKEDDLIFLLYFLSFMQTLNGIHILLFHMILFSLLVVIIVYVFRVFVIVTQCNNPIAENNFR